MTLTIDSENQLISGDIRALAAALSADRKPSGLGLLSSLRAELGQKIHREYAEKRRREWKNAFQDEIALTLNLQLGTWRLCLKGRADGIIKQDENTLILEEVKSLALSGGQLDLLTASDLDPFIYQLGLYTLALRQIAEGSTIYSRLVLISLQDGHQREVDVPLAGEILLTALTQAVEKLGITAEGTKKRAKKRENLAQKLIFPYPELREPQKILMREIERACQSGRPILATAPTGSGKTVSAIFPALKAALQNNSHLWFTTAKRTQAEMAARTFIDIVEAAHLEGELLAINMAPKEEMCPTGHFLCHPLTCPFLADFKERLNKSGLLSRLTAQQTVLNGSTIYREALEENLCPYEVAVALCARVDLIIADYNYLYDKHPYRAAASPDGAGAPIAVIDEAHNLFDRVRASYSPAISLEEIEVAQKIVASYCQKSLPERQLTLDIGEVKSYADADLGRAINNFLSTISAEICQHITSGPDEESGEISGKWRISPNLEEWSARAEEAASLLVRYAIFRKMARIAGPEDAVQKLLAAILQIGDLLLSAEGELVPYSGTAGTKGELGILCLSPARYLSAVHKRFLTTIAISATLNPLDYFADILGFSPFNPLSLDLPSPFPPEGRLVVIDKSCETRYSKRSQSYRPIAERIAEIVKLKPGNYMAFFPSFAFLEAVAKELLTLDLSAMQILSQKRAMKDNERQSLLESLRSGNDILLLAVMGGVFAEGIDLPGEALIGAIIVGPALPQVGFERSQMCAYFEEKREAGFAYGMLFPGMQKVVQAAGRVIRTASDRGIIVLLDRRFAEHPYCDALPGYWYDEHAGELITDDLQATIRHFWQHPGEKPLIVQKEKEEERESYGFYDYDNEW